GLGGLHVIGSERHEARRIDNQLRGRAGRQGDPGSSRFYISLEDDLMRLFGSENLQGMMDRLGVEEDEPIEHSLVTRAIESAQRRVEARNFDIRKHLLEYDDVMNQQREVIYGQRRQLLEDPEMKDVILGMVDALLERWVAESCPPRSHPDTWDLEGLLETASQFFLVPGRLSVAELQDLEPEEIQERLRSQAEQRWEEREGELESDNLRELARVIALRTIDTKWMDHLEAMDGLREGIGLRAYGQLDPLIEYKMEAFDMFEELRQNIQEDIVKLVYRLQVVQQVERRSVVRGLQARHQSLGNLAAGAEGQAPVALAPAGEPSSPPKQEPVRVQKVGRNDPCPCGSGKKYKHCHGR
ncbi:MAG: SEC-C metal-binding domain-containing protein, partial [Bacillota bacterium]|nr:SEC-C metal-binding domain-containing protein [Bacillota bacterium]